MSASHPPGLGVGIVWWPPLDALCRGQEGLVDVVEAEPEAFWLPAADGSGFRSCLPAALAHLPQPKLLHGVGAPLGGGAAPPEGHAAALGRDVAAVSPVHVSEHLSLTRFCPRPDAGPVSAGFMLPPVASRAGVAQAVANIRAHRAKLGGVPLAVETTVSYLPPAPGEWPDGDFVAAVAEEADCGILLDLHNVLCNARNGRQGVAAFFEALPLERVWEVHLAGGEASGGFWLDAHCGLVEPELMEIAATLLPRLHNVRAVILEILPEHVPAIGLGAVAGQLGRIRDLWDTRGTGAAPPLGGRMLPWAAPPLTPEEWEALLGCAVTGLPQPAVPDALAAWWRSAVPALDIYRRLVGEGRASAVAAAAPSTTRLLLRGQGGPGTRAILADFWSRSAPFYSAADEARAFLVFLAETHPALPGLVEATREDGRLLATI